MDIKLYRKQYEAELSSDDPVDPGPRGAALAFSFAQAPRRAEPISETAGLLARLTDASASAEARTAALDGLKASRFLGELFQPFRPAFLNALRRLLRPDVDPELRTDAVEALASERDPVTQDLLRQGLVDPTSALVPAAKALQFLAYDDHADAAGLAAEVFRGTDDLHTKEAALRVMATDPTSQGFLEQLMMDKSQPRTIRVLGAMGLNFLDPQRFRTLARGVVLDGTEYDDIRATSLGTLANVAGQLGDDAVFLDQVSALAAGEGPEALNAPAARFVVGIR